MKSRTSFFNPTVFKKDLTRFAPTWALYTVGLFMMMAVCMDTPYDYRKAENLLSILGVMAVLNLGYGLLNGQLLLCNDSCFLFQNATLQRIVFHLIISFFQRICKQFVSENCIFLCCQKERQTTAYPSVASLLKTLGSPSGRAVAFRRLRGQ